MDRQQVLQWTAVGVVLLTLLASGPAVGVLQPTADRPESVGGGNATVSSVHVAGDATLDRGRFGTGVVYLRVPDARVNVAAVTGLPTIRYHVDAPGLSVHESTTRVIDGTDVGVQRLALADRALPPDRVSGDRYRVRLSVRVQSFDGDWTVFSRNTTVEVEG